MGIKENIEHIDTNIVVRLITGDNPKQYKKAKKLVCKKNKTFIFEDSAMMEVVYVLSGKIYNYPRNKIAEGIRLISRFESIYYNKGLIEDSLNLYVANPSLSYVDCYLTAVTNLSGEKPLWTFDHKLAIKCPVAKEL